MTPERFAQIKRLYRELSDERVASRYTDKLVWRRETIDSVMAAMRELLAHVERLESEHVSHKTETKL